MPLVGRADMVPKPLRSCMMSDMTVATEPEEAPCPAASCAFWERLRVAP